jgi:hypothetical protein
VFRRGFNPGPAVLEANGFLWVGPFQNRSDEFLNSPLANLATVAQRWPITNASGNAVITLTNGQKYYFQLLFKEGTGGDYTSVAWKGGDADPINGDPEIPVRFDVIWRDALISRATDEPNGFGGQLVNFTVSVLSLEILSTPPNSAFSSTRIATTRYHRRNWQ